MQKTNVLVLIGGISKDSLNKRLFEFVREAAGGSEKNKMAFDVYPIADLPFFSQDLENDPPAVAVDYKARIAASDAALFITPEYNRSFPGVLKNAIDWGTRPPGTNLWRGKPAAIMGTSPGAIGTFGAQNQLRQVLSFLDLRMMSQPEFYFSFPRELPDGRLPEQSAAFVKKFVDAFVAWVDQQK